MEVIIQDLVDHVTLKTSNAGKKAAMELKDTVSKIL